MNVVDVALVPVRAGRLLVRAADDLHAVAEHARRDPDPVEQVRERLDALLDEITTLTALITPLAEIVARLIATAASVDVTGQRIVDGGQDLERVAASLDRHSAELVAGGQELTVVARGLDGHSAELIDGGEDLTAVAQELAASLRVFRAVLPQLLDGLDTVEHLEGAVESMAETVEPLAGAAEGVGRITRKLTRRGADG